MLSKMALTVDCKIGHPQRGSIERVLKFAVAGRATAVIGFDVA
jgi:hypothetical protein